ncbi:MAG: hypothetical protein WAT93_12680 [Pontixanthobacter sp.]
MRLIIQFLALMAVLSSPAQAKWYEAQSDHFVIYADDSEKDVRRYAEMLERYHASLEFVTGRKIGVPSPSNRVTIFAVGSQRDVQKLMGEGSRNVAGFYVPSAGGSRAFVQDIRIKNGYPDISTIVLLHEYAHHFLIASSRFARPRWLDEGAAEFFASAGFPIDGSVLIGRPAVHRAGELAYADEVTAEELFDPELYERNKGRRYDAFYGRSWLLYHYLNFSEDRKGQLNAYQQRVIDGASAIDAAREVFGDLHALELELDRYMKQRRMFTYNLKPEWIDPGMVTLRELPRGEAEMMPLRIKSQRGVNEEQAAEIVAEARTIAAKYPDDAGVQTALAEAEYDSGNDAAAIAAADRAIAIDPARKNAYVQKGYALFHVAEDAEDRDAAYAAAMKPFGALNKLENDHPLPLIYYYRSYTDRGMEPVENAKLALERAAMLAPFDQALWFQVGMMQATEGKIELAKLSIKPLANDPHGRRGTSPMKLIMAALERAEEGKPLDMSLFAKAISDNDKGGGDGDNEGDDESPVDPENENAGEG